MLGSAEESAAVRLSAGQTWGRACHRGEVAPPHGRGCIDCGHGGINSAFSLRIIHFTELSALTIAFDRSAAVRLGNS